MRRKVIVVMDIETEDRVQGEVLARDLELAIRGFKDMDNPVGTTHDLLVYESENSETVEQLAMQVIEGCKSGHIR